VTQDALHYNYHHAENHTLYKDGCRHALMDFYGHTILIGLALTLLFITVAQVGLSARARIR
jgi:hypothetical protein